MNEHKTVTVSPTLEEVLRAYYTEVNFRGHPLEFFVAVVAAWNGQTINASPDDIAVGCNLVQQYLNGEETCTTCDDPQCQIRVAFSLLDQYVESVMVAAR